MQPLEILRQLTTAQGKELTLLRRGSAYFIKIDGQELMSSQTHGSEEALVQLAWQELSPTPAAPRVLVGGLGMGFTLRAALDQLPAEAQVAVAEILEPVVRWNRAELGPLARHPLQDPRVRLKQADVATLLAPDTFHLILLDVDNGPAALTVPQNHQLYTVSGLQQLRRSLKAGGVLAVWSAAPDPPFERRLRQACFSCRPVTVCARAKHRGARHTLFIARR